MHPTAGLTVTNDPGDPVGGQPRVLPSPASGSRSFPSRTVAVPSGRSAANRDRAPRLIPAIDITAKAVLLVLLGLALVYPDLGHMEDKASGLRAVVYPMLAFTLPATWWLWRREAESFPWAADLMVTTTLFTDILGNRMNLFDTVDWFDDWVHVMNPGLLTAAVILLTVPRTSTLGATLDRALAFGMTAAVAWEVSEYAAFISESTERRTAYPDTLADLALGAVGAVAAALVIHAGRARQGVPAYR